VIKDRGLKKKGKKRTVKKISFFLGKPLSLSATAEI